VLQSPRAQYATKFKLTMKIKLRRLAFHNKCCHLYATNKIDRMQLQSFLES